jgi:hypothetical protein
MYECPGRNLKAPARERREKIKVGLKYCGGCRAGYDRVEMVDTIRTRLADKVEFVSADSTDAVMVLIVSGCSSACTKPDFGVNRLVRFITSPDEAEGWVREILEAQGHVRNQP